MLDYIWFETATLARLYLSNGRLEIDIDNKLRRKLNNHTLVTEARSNKADN